LAKALTRAKAAMARPGVLVKGAQP
jgi:hypothetical protein